MASEPIARRRYYRRRAPAVDLQVAAAAPSPFSLSDVQRETSCLAACRPTTNGRCLQRRRRRRWGRGNAVLLLSNAALLRIMTRRSVLHSFQLYRPLNNIRRQQRSCIGLLLNMSCVKNK